MIKETNKSTVECRDCLFNAGAGSYFRYKQKGIRKVQNRVSWKLRGERRVLFARHSRERSLGTRLSAYRKYLTTTLRRLRLGAKMTS